MTNINGERLSVYLRTTVITHQIALMHQKKSLIVKMWLTKQAGKAALIIRPLQPLLIQQKLVRCAPYGPCLSPGLQTRTGYIGRLFQFIYCTNM